jgi:hypothetical protein
MPPGRLGIARWGRFWTTPSLSAPEAEIEIRVNGKQGAEGRRIAVIP